MLAEKFGVTPDTVLGMNAVQFFGTMEAAQNIALAEKAAYDEELEKQRRESEFDGRRRKNRIRF